MALHTIAATIFIVLLRVAEWVTAKPGATLADGTSAERLAEIANNVVEISLGIALVVTLVELARELYRWYSRRRSDVPSSPALRHRQP